MAKNTFSATHLTSISQLCHELNWKDFKVKMENGEITTRDHLQWHTELRNNRFGLLIDQIEGINHEETTTVTIESWRIIYKK